MRSWPSDMLRELAVVAGPDGDDLFRMRASGDQETPWFNVTADQLLKIANVLDNHGVSWSPLDVINSIRAVVDYSMPSEAADYQREGCPSGHVFLHLRAVSDWLDVINR